MGSLKKLLSVALSIAILAVGTATAFAAEYDGDEEDEDVHHIHSESGKTVEIERHGSSLPERRVSHDNKTRESHYLRKLIRFVCSGMWFQVQYPMNWH